MSAENMSSPDMISADVAIIGGSGLYQLDGLEEIERRTRVTRWGEPSSEIVFMQTGQLSTGQSSTSQSSTVPARRLAFIARHGLQHTIAPHKINYRANLWALKECGVKKVIAVAAVGGITDRMGPQTIVIPDQIIDYTHRSGHSFFEDELKQVTHIDFTWPYTASLRSQLLEAASRASIEAVDGGVYAATQGPRLESAAEITRLKRDGADIVGMTGMPEASLARELGMEYACCALVVNWAAGCAGTATIAHDEMQATLEKGMQQVKSLLVSALQAI